MNNTNKQIHLGIIPVGSVSIYNFVSNILKNIKITDTEEMTRWWNMNLNAFERFHTINHLPNMFPRHHEYGGIKIQNDIRFQVCISNFVFSEKYGKEINDKVDTFCPWSDDEMTYEEASRICYETIIDKYCNYVVILTNEYLDSEEEQVVGDILKVCEKYSREYKIVTEYGYEFINELIR